LLIDYFLVYFVLISYSEYEKRDSASKKSIADLLANDNLACVDIEFEIPPRSKVQSRPVEF